MSEDKKGSKLPHTGDLEKAFGGNFFEAHKAHIDGMFRQSGPDGAGARAYAHGGGKVRFESSPTMHQSAHEAAHLVQQRPGMPKK